MNSSGALSPDFILYLSPFSPAQRARFMEFRDLVLNFAPEAEEVIRYGVPTWRKQGNLIHAGLYKNHLGIYPAPRSHIEFSEELSRYKGGKGTLQIPHEQALPVDLISRMISHRLSLLRP